MNSSVFFAKCGFLICILLAISFVARGEVAGGKHQDLETFLSCVQPQTGLAVAHRGGPMPGYPENSLATMRKAVSNGAKAIEVDVRQAADGTLVLFHDDGLDRTSTGKGWLLEKTYEELSHLKLVGPDGKVTNFHIPTLDEALSWANGRAILFLDVKPGTSFEDVVSAIDTANAFEYSVVTTYYLEHARQLTNLDDRVFFSLQISTKEMLDRFQSARLDITRLVAWTGYKAPKPSLWRLLKDKGITVSYGALWTEDRSAQADGDDTVYAQLIRKGADFVSTDRYQAAVTAIQNDKGLAGALAKCLPLPPNF